jgi:transcriptional regulator with XRE-family HTH domain
MENPNWPTLLRDARQTVGITQKKLGALAGISPETVRGYERGARRPRRDYLIAILDALKLDRGQRNQILVGAGLAPDGLQLRPDISQASFTLDEAKAEVARYRWPAFLLDENGQVLIANAVAQRVWGVSLDEEFTEPAARHLLSVASNPRFADRCVNWGEAVSIMASGWKHHHRGAEDLENPSPYLAAVFEHFIKGDPRYIARFIDIWQKAEPLEYKMRWSYPVVWNEPGVGEMRFHCFVSSASEIDGYTFSDWIPLDADTWNALDRIDQARSTDQ